MRTGRACLLVALGVMASCSGNDATQPADTAVVRVAVLPDQADDRLRAQYDPLLVHIDEVANVETELIIPATYDDLLTLFAAGEADLAWFGGLTYLQAERDAGAVPLAMRDVDLEFTSDFIVHASTTGLTLDDFAGSNFAFGPELSTSGHLMPRFDLEQLTRPPEELFGSVVHSTGHDQTAQWVADGTVDVGAINSIVMEALFRDGTVSDADVRVLQRTRPYRNYVWATRGNLDNDLRNRLLDGFLAFDVTDADDRVILDRLGAGGFVPATTSDFSDLREAADAVGLLEGGDGP